MPFSKCSTVPCVLVLRDYWYFSQNYDLPQGTESNSRKGTNNLIQEY